MSSLSSFITLQRSNSLFKILMLKWTTQLLFHLVLFDSSIVTTCSKQSHISPVLKSLHWLPVKSRILFKILLLMFKAVNGLAPPYLCELAIPYDPSRDLRSAEQKLLIVPKARCKTLGSRSFAVAGPSEWNKLPITIRQLDSINVFKKTLKTYLFNQYFN